MTSDFDFDLVLDEETPPTSPPLRPIASDDDILLFHDDSEEEEDSDVPDDEANPQAERRGMIIERLRDLGRDLLDQLQERMATLAERQPEASDGSGSEAAPSPVKRRRTARSRMKRLQPIILTLDRRQAGDNETVATSRRLLFPRGHAGSSKQYGARDLGALFRRGLGHARSKLRTAVVLRVACLLVENLLAGARMTKRDLFYKDVKLFRKQAVVDALVDDLATTVGVRRVDLGIVAASKGLFSGNMRLHLSEGVVLDGRDGEQGVLIPGGDDIQSISIAEGVIAVVVIEKEVRTRTLATIGVGLQNNAQAVFRTLSAARLDDVVLLTGKGYPDLSTAELVKRISEDHPHLICAALVDGDPHGLDILSVYRSGSSNRAFDRSRVSTPGLVWLGVRSEHLQRNTVEESSLLLMTLQDRKKALSMLARQPPLGPELRLELMRMLHRARKAEIEALPDVVAYVQDRLDELVEDDVTALLQ